MELELLGDLADRKKFVQTVGIKKRHVVEKNGLTSNDLCFEAARNLIDNLNWAPQEIECLIFVTQTPDYQLPSTACILQDRLELPKSCYTLQISLGCSGWVYGLSVISALLSSGNIKKGLLLVGDTVTLTKSELDKTTYPLFGDAGTATAIQYDSKEAEPIFFETGSDGSGHKAIIIEDGGYRNPVTEESFIVQEQPDGSIRNRLQSYLNGQDVFIFGISRAPKTIKSVLDYAQWDLKDIDYILLHQANKFMLDKIVKKLKIDYSKVPLSLQDYGNTSSASIPLTMVTQIKNELKKKANHSIVASGFGVGLSWATVATKLNNLTIPDIIFVN